MAGDDLKLQLVIQAILDAKGFEEAKIALGGLADTTNKAVGPVKELSDAQNISRREIRLATAEVLRYSGVTQEAGLIGRLAATGFVALGDSAEFANFAIVGATLGLSVLIPLILSWIGKSAEATAEQNALKESIDGAYKQLEPFLERLKGINQQFDIWAQHAKEHMLDEQATQIEKTTKLVNEAQAALDHHVQGWALFGHQVRVSTEDDAAYNKEQERLTKNLRNARDELDKLLLAQGKGVSVEKMIHDAVKTGDGILDKRKTAIKELTADEKRAADFRRQQAQDAMLDMVADGVAQGKAWKKDMEARGKHNNDVLEAQADLDRRRKAADDKLAAETIEIEQSMAEAKIAAIDRIRTASIDLMGTLFGKNKAAASANVIVDTAQAIMRTNAQLGWPAAIPFDIALAAEGAAQLANINKAGFDNPMSDLIAERFGSRWAYDLLQKIDGGFSKSLDRISAGGQHTTINRGVTVQSLHMSGILGVNETDVLKQLNRKLTAVGRLEQRTTLGR